MICDRCDGRGWRWRPLTPQVNVDAIRQVSWSDYRGLINYSVERYLCTECWGHGVVHCCEGERACPNSSLDRPESYAS